MTHTAIEDQASRAIIQQIYIALDNLQAPPALLAIIGSWGDTLDDDDILAELEGYNANGKSLLEKQ